MSELGRPHPAVERYVSKAVSPNERIEALEAEVERLTRERAETRIATVDLVNTRPTAFDWWAELPRPKVPRE